VASVIYNAMYRKTKRHGIIATAVEVCNATRPLGNKPGHILRQSVRGYVRAIRAIKNTPAFLTETSFGTYDVDQDFVCYS
jgi:hypothetical protein